MLREHIRNCINATDKPFGVNIPLLRGDAEKLVNVTIGENVKIVFTSAGHPGKFIDILKKNDITVVHVVPSLKFAKKAESVGCDAIVGEGVEAGGHNGADEITTFCLIPELVDSLNIPVIAAGGIADGRGILAALSLGAEGVQIGTRFAATVESSAHPNYKKTLLEARENDTVLILKKVGLTRVIKNQFSDSAVQLEQSGSRKEELLNLLGEKREQLGIFEGDLNNGMIEAGQGIGQIDKILTVKELFKKLITELENSFQSLKNEIT